MRIVRYCFSEILFHISGIEHGQFELKTNPGIPITSFYQQNITDGLVLFKHDGSNFASAYNVSVSNAGIAGQNPAPQVADIFYIPTLDQPYNCSSLPSPVLNQIKKASTTGRDISIGLASGIGTAGLVGVGFFGVRKWMNSRGTPRVHDESVAAERGNNTKVAADRRNRDTGPNQGEQGRAVTERRGQSLSSSMA